MSSSIARSKCSIGIVPSSAALTCMTRAPRASCACQIWPIVGNSQSVRTTFDRCVKRRPLASALTPAESDVVTAISSGTCVDEPGEGSAGGFLPLHPVLPRRALVVPVLEVLLVGSAHRVRQRPLRARVDVHLPLEDRESVPAPSRERGGLNGQGRPSSSPRVQAGLLRALPAPVARWRARSRGLRSRAPCSHSARRRASRRRTDAPAG